MTLGEGLAISLLLNLAQALTFIAVYGPHWWPFS